MTSTFDTPSFGYSLVLPFLGPCPFFVEGVWGVNVLGFKDNWGVWSLKEILLNFCW